MHISRKEVIVTELEIKHRFTIRLGLESGSLRVDFGK